MPDLTTSGYNPQTKPKTEIKVFINSDRYISWSITAILVLAYMCQDLKKKKNFFGDYNAEKDAWANL